MHNISRAAQKADAQVQRASLSSGVPRSVLNSSRVLADLTPALWQGCYNHRESTMQQLAPYVGKMKSGIANALVVRCSEPGDTVFDPFAGSGVVPYEALTCGRHVIANDLSPYAQVVTAGKLFGPATRAVAVAEARHYTEQATADAAVRLDAVPGWVRKFFHPRTLRETLALVRRLRADERWFLLACTMGILHHVRPGFLSYPASHLTPYLRLAKYPPQEDPDMYAYRPVAPRLEAKVERAYRRAPSIDPTLRRVVMRENAMALSLPDESVDAIVSSPPYLGALDYARDNRLRLWFLGVEDYRELEQELTSNERVYVEQMSACVRELHRVLRAGRLCALVLGEVRRSDRIWDTSSIIAELAGEGGRFRVERIVDDEIPDIRRSRRRTRTTKHDRVLILRRLG
ncbi:hypothetical protein AMK68_03295 [candidate division KD3-62 bacterium DG_56]|uniref:Ribosomal RNA large subunit methyltransferase K/L-like methyltransferase domain-containing protein n=1 Tax=candidate division KD3-62 bacterium DG_56 TaxID=1704032 RepID=A0A0S7XMY0_9BACT|nr:MAG: hypothetical protein AMK68_03295 [candidate division KD3-62 bacterium DG_56]